MHDMVHLLSSELPKLQSLCLHDFHPNRGHSWLFPSGWWPSSSCGYTSGACNKHFVQVYPDLWQGSPERKLRVERVNCFEATWKMFSRFQQLGFTIVMARRDQGAWSSMISPSPIWAYRLLVIQLGGSPKSSFWHQKKTPLKPQCDDVYYAEEHPGVYSFIFCFPWI